MLHGLYCERTEEERDLKAGLLGEIKRFLRASARFLARWLILEPWTDSMGEGERERESYVELFLKAAVSQPADVT